MRGPSTGLGKTRKLLAGGTSWDCMDTKDVARNKMARKCFMGAQYSAESREFTRNRKCETPGVQKALDPSRSGFASLELRRACRHKHEWKQNPACITRRSVTSGRRFGYKPCAKLVRANRYRKSATVLEAAPWPEHSRNIRPPSREIENRFRIACL